MKINIVNTIVQTGMGIVLAGAIWVMDSRAEARDRIRESDNITQNQTLQKEIVENLAGQYIYSLQDIIDILNEKFKEQKEFIENQDRKLNNTFKAGLAEEQEKYKEMYYEDQDGQLYYVWLKQYPDSAVVIKSLKIENNFDR